MKIIGIDSSGLVASVAIVQDDVLVAEYTTDYKKTHSQTLLPMLDELKRMTELELATVDAIAIASGPGSFTGLRIGSATAKGLGLALDIPLIEVPTLEGIAYNLWGSDRLICPIMDARRSQVYTGIYEFVSKDGEYALNTVLTQCAIGMEEICDRLKSMDREVIMLGDAVPIHRQYIEDTLKDMCVFAPAGRNRQRAANIAILGAKYYAEGRFVSADMHAPEYLRVSQAEREKAERATDG